MNFVRRRGAEVFEQVLVEEIVGLLLFGNLCQSGSFHQKYGKEEEED